MSRPRYLRAVVIFVVVWLQFQGYRWWNEPVVQLRASTGGKGAFLRERVMVATSVGHHDDVYMSLVATLESLFLPPSSKSSSSTPLPPSSSSTSKIVDLSSSPIRVYGRGLRFGLGAQVLSKLGIYNSPNVLYSTEKVLKDVDAGWGGEGADVIVLPTAELDVKHFSAALWKIWEARPDDRKFTLVCLVHDARNREWIQKWSAPWAKAGALRVLTISGSVSDETSKNFITFADEPDLYHLGYAQIPIDAHIPILPIERLPGFNAHGRHPGDYLFSKDKDGLGELRVPTKDVNQSRVLDKTWGRRDGKVLRDVVIQGTFSAGRRNYIPVLDDLEAEIALDPEAWGYLPSANPSAAFIPASRDNFVLHLVGNGKPDFKIPPRLQHHVVKFHESLSYPDFFSLMGSMDLVLPAFTPRGGYYDGRASSTVAMAMQCETPLLVTPRIFRAYSYLTPETTILRPQTISEITAIKTLRTAQYSPPARGYGRKSDGIASDGDASGEHPSIRRDAAAMVTRGWATKEQDWREFKMGIEETNRDVVRKLILES